LPELRRFGIEAAMRQQLQFTRFIGSLLVGAMGRAVRNRPAR
jgi:hypothetical protein